MAQQDPEDFALEPGTTAAAATGFERRRLLSWGLALGVSGLVASGSIGVGGCSVSDPRIETPVGGAPNTDPSTGRSQPPGSGQPEPGAPAPSPTFAGAARAAESERRLAGLAAAALAGPWRKTLGGRAGVLASVRDGHLAHATALQGGQPTTRPTENPAAAIKPNAAAKSLAAALDALAVAERAEAARSRISALNTTGLSALLWGSLSIAASSYATAIEGSRPVRSEKVKRPQPSPLLSDVEAMQQLVTQLHTVNYGYPMAIGQLTDGSRRNSAIRQLRSRRGLRDSLVTILLARRASIPVAEPAYVPTVRPRNNATAGQLVQDMETRLAPFVGLWLAAAPTVAERTRAFDNLAVTVATALQWGAPLRIWPGWVS